MLNAESLNGKVELERDFMPGPFGQIHVRIARPISDPTDKPPLFLFPPTPHSGDYYKPYMGEMAKDRIVVAIDTPGYGDSTRPEALLNIEDFAASAVSAIDALELDTKFIDVLGYHTGGLIACEIALARPDFVRRILLPGFPYFVGEARQRAYERYAIPDTIEPGGEHLLKKWRYSKIPMQAGVSLERTQEHFNDLIKSYPHTWRGFHAVFTYPSEKRIHNVSHPVLLMSVDGSLKDETKTAASIFPNATYHHFDIFTFGIFDLGAEIIAKKSREFLDV